MKKNESYKSNLIINKKFLSVNIERSNNIIILMNTDGSIYYQNSLVQSVLGYTPEKMSDRNILDFIHEDSHMTYTALLDSDQRNSNYQIRFKKLSGGWIKLYAMCYSFTLDKKKGLILSANVKKI